MGMTLLKDLVHRSALKTRNAGDVDTGAGALSGAGGRDSSVGVLGIPNAAWVVVPLVVEDFDNDTMHDVGTVAGTVAKTAASAAVVGTGTAFLTELAVGMVINIPDAGAGGTSESRVIQSITNNTNLTVASNFANTASGKTARKDTALRIRRSGLWLVSCEADWTTNTTGVRFLEPRKNGSVPLFDDSRPGAGGAAIRSSASQPVQLVAGDFVELYVHQTSGAALSYDPGVLSAVRLGTLS